VSGLPLAASYMFRKSTVSWSPWLLPFRGLVASLWWLPLPSWAAHSLGNWQAGQQSGRFLASWPLERGTWNMELGMNVPTKKALGGHQTTLANAANLHKLQHPTILYSLVASISLEGKVCSLRSRRRANNLRVLQCTDKPITSNLFGSMQLSLSGGRISKGTRPTS
jgi:hypothetical protein